MCDWQPILTRETDADLWQVTTELFAALSDTLAAEQPADHSLASGQAGIALPLLHAASDPMLAAALPHSEDLARRCLASAIDRLAELDSTSLSLFGGVTGVAWALELIRPLQSDEHDSGDGEFDDLVADQVCTATPGDEFDLIDGSIGLGVYLLERPGLREDADIVTALCDRIDTCLQDTSQDVIVYLQTRLAAGLEPLGLAHGVAGVLALAAALEPFDASGERCRRLAERAMVLLHRGAVHIGEEVSPIPLAWCQGPLSRATALIQAGKTFGRDDWLDSGLAIALAATRTPRDATRVLDSGFCHGATGVAHLFNRLYQTTGHTAFRAAARYWYWQILDLRVHGGGWSGLRWYDHDPVEGWRLTADPGFLSGAAGVLAGLLAGFSRKAPVWDRALLLSGVEAINDVATA